MNRYVKKGEKGIKILAPTPYTIRKEQTKLDQKTGKAVCDQDGEPVKETVEITMNAFKVVNTFDISQTDGEELPSLGVNELVGNIEGYGHLLEAQNVKTVIHEMAHQKLHSISALSNQKKSRESKEVEAESIAYVVCKHYVIDTSEYSFGYVAGWSEGKEIPELKASIGMIRNAASEML